MVLPENIIPTGKSPVFILFDHVHGRLSDASWTISVKCFSYAGEYGRYSDKTSNRTCSVYSPTVCHPRRQLSDSPLLLDSIASKVDHHPSIFSEFSAARRPRAPFRRGIREKKVLKHGRADIGLWICGSHRICRFETRANSSKLKLFPFLNAWQTFSPEVQSKGKMQPPKHQQTTNAFGVFISILASKPLLLPFASIRIFTLNFPRGR